LCYKRRRAALCAAFSIGATDGDTTMDNFLRAIRLALRYKWTFAASVFCAVMVGLLWGGNIGAVAPFVQVAFEKKTLHDWVHDEIAEHEQLVANLEREKTEFAIVPPQESEEQRLARLGKMEQRDAELMLKNASLEFYRRIEPPIQRWLPNDAFQTLVFVVVLLMIGTTIKSAFLALQTILVNRLAQLAIFNLRKDFYRHCLKMDLAQFSEEGASDLMSRFTYDMESLSNGLENLFGKAVREPLKMIVCLIGAGLICWRLLVFSLIIAPLCAVLVSKLAKALKRANRRAMEEMSQIYNLLTETFDGIKVVKAFTMERYERRRFHDGCKNYYRKAARIARYDSLTHPLTEMIGVTIICFALLAGAYLVIYQQTTLFGIKMSNEPLSFTRLALFYGLLAGVSDPARKLSEIFSRMQRASAAADRIFQQIDRPATILDPAQPRRLPRHTKTLQFNHIGFAYSPGKPVLNDIQLDVRFGERIAIVGPNGCGKSTLANLVPRFYDPTQGAVLLDGVDLRTVRRRELRAQIGLVTQEPMLFDDTVFNNIRYGSPHATAEQVYEASQAAHCHRFIEERLPHGYQTEVGTRGNQLSGGQRQRLSLARAILRDPAILILDEATSQVDLESEQIIHQVLEQFTRNRTTIIITHRMSTLALADRIVVMDAGRILDSGTHEQLLRRCELYGRLYEIQFRELPNNETDAAPPMAA
jgi:subfamily B ATP-binding cassette protein MsbA